eukprot:superscaffoldBa00002961_g15756
MFHQMKTEVDRKRSSTAIDPEDTTDPAETEESEQEEEKEPPEKKDPDCIGELILTRLTELNNIQQLREELQQMKEDCQKTNNDLRQTTYALQKENTSLRAQAVTKVTERACRVFPESQLVISTLLPRTDTPPHVIHHINMEITQNCSTLPNIHLVHHTTISTWHSYDGLHLDRDGVRVFAKIFKDVALGRSPNSTSTAGCYRTSRHPKNTPSQPSHCHPAPPRCPHPQPPAPLPQQ